jgi:hypothetical protein
LKAYKIESILSGHAPLSFFNFLAAWSKRKINMKMLLASMKTLTNSQDCSGSRIIISIPASLSVIGKFFLRVHPLLDAGKICVNVHTVSKAASGMIFQNYKQVPVSVFRFKISSSEPLKRVPGRIFRIGRR